MYGITYQLIVYKLLGPRINMFKNKIDKYLAKAGCV